MAVERKHKQVEVSEPAHGRQFELNPMVDQPTGATFRIYKVQVQYTCAQACFRLISSFSSLISFPLPDTLSGLPSCLCVAIGSALSLPSGLRSV